MGLRSAVKLRCAARWASWADSLKMINDRHPEIARNILDAIHDESDADGTQALLSSASSVRNAGFTLPFCCSTGGGTQFARHQRGFEKFHNRHFSVPRVDPLLLLRSCACLWTGCSGLIRRPSESCSCDVCGCPPAPPPDCSFLPVWPSPWQPWPPPVSLRSRWGLGQKGVSSRKRSSAHLPRGGWPGAHERLVRDLDVHPVNNLDSRRLEVVVDGLSFFRGAQLAIDTTLVSPLSRNGTAPSTLCHRERSCHGACQNQEGKTLPGARGGLWEGSVCRPGRRDWGPLVQ